MSAQTDFLRQHAIQNVWCSPNQDHQYTFELPRISGAGGALRVTTANGMPLDLPDTFSRWQVFQIGGISPNAFNLLTRDYAWVNAQVQAHEKKTVVRLFSNNGIVAGMADVFYRYTQGNNLIVAVRMHTRTPISWTAAKIYLQVYSNSYWQTAEGVADPVGFETHGAVVETSQQIAAFSSLYNTAAQLAEHPFQISFWHNGLRKERNAVNIVVGDSVWFELDGSIKKRVTFPIAGLATFDSTLDRVRKYLLHPPKDGNSMTIDYYDDVEIFLQGSTAGKPAMLYPRLALQDVRQLTHRDYSVVVSNVTFQGAALRMIGGGEYNTQSLQINVRKSGYTRPLLHEHSFLQELYKLNEVDVARALTGIDATIPFWRAAYLEASAYPELMRAKDVCAVTYELVEKAYGYHAMAKALAVTPAAVQSPGNTGFVFVPYLHQYGCTAYEYDVNGLFLGWHQHLVGDRYFVRNSDARTVEFIAGLGSETLEEIHNAKTANLRTDCNYRVYLRQQVGGQLQSAFQDITGSNKYTLSPTGQFTWLSTVITDYPTVRSDRRFFAKDYEVDVTDGRIAVTLQSHQQHGNTVVTQNLGIPLGQVDVMFNGRSLIRGLHYFYQNNQIIITARHYVNQAAGVKQKVHVRMYGFCRADGSLYPEGDIGFIEHGLLSNNNRFDVRDGRVSRVVVDGCLHTMEDLLFSEDSDQVAPIDATNGQPYMVKDIFVPLRPFVAPDTWTLIEKAREDTKKVSDYITLKKPQPSRGPVTAVPYKHELVSPFLAKILYDLLYGRLGLPAKDLFTRQDVIDVCKNYEPLLQTDPITKDLNSSYVVIQPHTRNVPIGVTAKQWQFLNQVVQLYAPGKVDLNNSLSVNS